MKSKQLLIPALCLSGAMACTGQAEKEAQLPNILIIYVDDLGYGDIGVNGAVGVETPNIDRLARMGVNFTDAHCAAATCTPSRYALLTGSYAFRNNAHVLPGDAPLIIDPHTGTLPGMLQRAGYVTGVVGKWHLGLGSGKVNWNEEIIPGPREIGFDYSFLIPATGDRVPCVYVENQRVVGLDLNDPIEVSFEQELEGYPIGTKHPEELRMKADLQHSNTIINGISRIGFMRGGESALWKDEDFPIVLNQQAKAFMTENKDQPFFLYYSFQDIHVPRIPHPMFEGKSSMGPRGDAIAQVDWCVGELVQMLEDLGVADNTLIVFSSDNGPVLDDGYDDYAVDMLGSHNPSGPFRGGKYSAYEAGTRMPTIAYWPGVIEPGTVSDALLTQVDWFASFASLVGQELEQEEAPDSFNHMDAWLGKTGQGRQVKLQEAFTLALRDGDWKYIHPQERPTPKWLENKDIETGLSHEVQLYNLAEDLAEQTNVAALYPEKVREMQSTLKAIRQRGSRLAAARKNLAPTPPMGWNSWNWHGKQAINEEIVIQTIDAMVESGLRDAGYNYVIIDGGWRDTMLGPGGELLPHPTKFPNGMKYIADYAHSKGMKFGLHTVPGTHDCGTDKVGGLGHEETHIRQFVDWGVDFVKVDRCYYNLDPQPDFTRRDRRWRMGWDDEEEIKRVYTKWSHLLENCGRDIVFNISAYRYHDWYPYTCQMARTTQDIHAKVSGGAKFDGIPRSMLGVAYLNNEYAAFAGNGYWNDPDMMAIGDQGLSHEEQKIHFALWCIMSSPLILGNDPRNMTPEEKDMLLNPECIAVNQDPNEQGTLVLQDADQEVWVKNLSDGSIALLLMNKNPQNSLDATIDLAQFGFSNGCNIRDLYARKDAGSFSGLYTVNLQPRTGSFLRLYQ